ncbi:MAG: tyrosine-type recombinase/integrase [Thermoguttaceae bacterium]|jgi:integrase
MVYSNASSRGEKPAKPRPDFPLFPHATGRWAKKIKGKLHYFGPWADPDAALARYVEERDDLYAGRKPRRKGVGLTVKDLINKFLIAKKARVDAGELALGTFGDQYKTCKRVLSVFGGDRLVDDLAADDFETLRAQIAKTYGKLSRKVEIKRVRMLFRYAHEANLIDKPVRFGPGFVGPSRRELRCERQQNGERMFEAAEIRAMLAAAPIALKAMILLGINCGFGNTDVANLSIKNLDLKDGWCNYPRPKTGISRRCPLWPETVKAIKAALAARPAPQDKADSDLVFLTSNGQRWVWIRGNSANADATDVEALAHVSRADRVTDAMGKLLSKLGLARRGHTFYALRHTFETIGGDSRDQVAVDAIMGHSRDDMASVYRERIGDDRLRAVVEHVRTWLRGSRQQRQRRH